MTPTSPTTDRSTHIGEGARSHADTLRRRLLVCAPPTLLVLALSMVPAWQFTGWQWVVALMSVPVVTWGAWPFHRAAFAAGRHGSTTMDTLVSLGVTASTLWSWWALLFGGAGELGMRMSMTVLPRAASHHAEIYFEGACTITAFLLLGRWMEARARYRAGDALRSLLELGAKNANRVTIDPVTRDRRIEVVPASDLVAGDLFLVRPGDKVATDGEIVDGASALDASLVTGESLPVDVGVGDLVTGATINTWGTLTVRATRVGENTTLAQIGRMVVEAQAGKAPVQRLADAISSVFVPIVIAIAVATLIGWMIAGASPQAAFTAGVAVLVVACPCALGLATPTALLVGSGRASRLGIVIKSSQILEQIRTIDTMVLDKTGTVTTGRMELESVIACDDLPEDVVLAIAAGVETWSEHPVAQAIIAGAERRGVTADATTAFTNHMGLGASALVGKSAGRAQLALVGRASWLESHRVPIPDDVRRALAQARDTGASPVIAAVVDSWSEDVDYSSGAADGSTPAPMIPLDATSLPLATLTMDVQGMTCASCVRRVERKLSKLDGVSATVNLATESAAITLTKPLTNEELEAVVDAAGYRGRVVARTDADGAGTAGDLDAESSERPSSERILPDALEGARIIGVLIVRDQVKDSSPEAIAQLRDLDIEPILLTGDNESAARFAADRVGITRIIADVMPDEKRTVIADLQAQGRIVAMVGDGVNDAAALAQAGMNGLGIAMGTGTDVAIEAADITLVNSELTSAATAIRVSRKILRIIKQNLFWAFAYNVAMIPLAMAGLLNPMLASAAMAFSSVFVVTNSLRLRSAH